MAHTKSAGSSKNNRDSRPKYLGVKLADGELAYPGSIIVRQRGTRIAPGSNVRKGKDDSLYAIAAGMVRFATRRKLSFTGKSVQKCVVHIIAAVPADA